MVRVIIPNGTHLEALPGDGFTMCCFAVKIRGASVG